jgi:hypothetical protein
LKYGGKTETKSLTNGQSKLECGPAVATQPVIGTKSYPGRISSKESEVWIGRGYMTRAAQLNARKTGLVNSNDIRGEE